MQFKFIGKVFGFLTLLINALMGVRETIEPILEVVEQIKILIRDSKSHSDSDLKALTEDSPKIKKVLPKAIQELGIKLPEGEKDVLKSFISYVGQQPDSQRSVLYAKLASNLFRQLEAKVTEVEADTLVALYYLKAKHAGTLPIGLPATESTPTGQEAPAQ